MNCDIHVTYICFLVCVIKAISFRDNVDTKNSLDERTKSIPLETLWRGTIDVSRNNYTEENP